MKPLQFFILIFWVNVVFAQSVTISPETSGNQTLNSEGANLRLNALVTPTQGHLLLQTRFGLANAGRVGIGTNDPDAKLHIMDNMGTSTKLRVASLTHGGGIQGLEFKVNALYSDRTVFISQLESAP